MIEESWKGEVELLDEKYKEKRSLYTWRSVAISGWEHTDIMPSPPSPENTAILMYTSGSTGNPKGVCLTHHCIVRALIGLLEVTRESIGNVNDKDAYIGYLPLAHILELLAECIMLLIGIPVGYSSPFTLTNTSTKIIPGTLGDAPILKPSVMAAVPAVLDKIYKGINGKISESGSFKAGLVAFCMRYRAEWITKGYDTPIMNKLIFGNFKAILGGNCRVLLSGGAPLAEEAHRFIQTAMCLRLHQGLMKAEFKTARSIYKYFFLSFS